MNAAIDEELTLVSFRIMYLRVYVEDALNNRLYTPNGWLFKESKHRLQMHLEKV
jgi:hypothetical protein